MVNPVQISDMDSSRLHNYGHIIRAMLEDQEIELLKLN